ncbi:UDP-glucose dehydrogenase family protein [Caldiplasma sukawensis]
MKVAIVGLGYVGLVTAAVLASHGNEVVGIDVDRKKISMLLEGKTPIFEPMLEETLKKSALNLKFSNNFEDIDGCVLTYLCVPTPNLNGKIDLKYVFSAAEEVSKKNRNTTIVIKSTVLPGTAKKVSENTGLNVISNPEFTREGSAIQDTERPDRIIIGGRSTELIEKLWSFTKAPILITTNENAELIKYASNAFLAVKISFINQIADLCEQIPNTDVNVIAEGMGMDKRIGKDFLKAGLGYGGSCFPKDTIAISSFAKEKGVDMTIVNSAIHYNDSRVKQLAKKINDLSGSVKGKRVCILGLSFKDNTDDIRESRSLLLYKELENYGAILKAYDPVVRNIKDVNICENMEECIDYSEIVVTSTEWSQFSNIKGEMLKEKMVFDLRRILDPKTIDLMMGVGIGKD